MKNSPPSESSIMASLFMSSSIASAILEGPDFKIALINSKFTELFGERAFCEIFDVTEQVLTRKNLETLKHELENSVETLEQERIHREHFIAALTHDLRTPITAAKLNAQVIAMRNKSPDIQRSMERITKNMDRADQMIRDLLDVSLIKAGGKLALDLKKCHLGEVLQATVADVATINGDRFVLTMDENSEGIWDPHAFRRVIENLLSNAVKYGDPSLAISVTLKNLGNMIELIVHNYGKPIPIEAQAGLFQPFLRLKSRENNKQKGWGIGLMLVQEIVRGHHGEVSLVSNEEEGTSFIIRLPLQSEHSS